LRGPVFFPTRSNLIIYRAGLCARPLFLFTEVWESDIVMKLSFLGNFKPYFSNAIKNPK
jgi:hypothetical protein